MKVRVAYSIIKEVEIEVDDKFEGAAIYDTTTAEEEDIAYGLIKELRKIAKEEVMRLNPNNFVGVEGLSTEDGYTIWES